MAGKRGVVHDKSSKRDVPFGVVHGNSAFDEKKGQFDSWLGTRSYREADCMDQATPY